MFAGCPHQLSSCTHRRLDLELPLVHVGQACTNECIPHTATATTMASSPRPAGPPPASRSPHEPASAGPPTHPPRMRLAALLLIHSPGPINSSSVTYANAPCSPPTHRHGTPQPAGGSTSFSTFSLSAQEHHGSSMAPSRDACLPHTRGTLSLKPLASSRRPNCSHLMCCRSRLTWPDSRPDSRHTATRQDASGSQYSHGKRRRV